MEHVALQIQSRRDVGLMLQNFLEVIAISFLFLGRHYLLGYHNSKGHPGHTISSNAIN